jgi:undecaprenyl-diphosphatase
MFADAVELLALMLAAGLVGLLVLVVRGRRRGRQVSAAPVVAVGLAVALFGVQAVLGDDIVDAGGGGTRVDTAAAAFAAGHRTPALTAVAETLNVGGSLAGLTVVAAAVAVALLLRHRRLEAAVVVSAPAASGLLGPATKLGYDRARPPVAEHLVFVNDSSLPSGHTLDATIVLGVLAVVLVCSIRGRLARVAVVAAACAGVAVAGAARVYLGVHWATDVVAGWLLGGAWVAFTAAVLLVLTRRPGPRSVGAAGSGGPGTAPASGRGPAAVAHLRVPRPRRGTDDRGGRLAS